MKNLYLFLIILLLAARPGFSLSRLDMQHESKDKVVLITDRSIYITGERIHFSATVFAVDSTGTGIQSQILYVELIMPDGNKLASIKYLINQALAAGCLIIPDDVITGTYYIRAYTKQMRNNGPETYGYKQIRIVNPGRNEVLAGESKEKVSSGQLVEPTTDHLTDLGSVSVEKNIYARGDSVKLTIHTANISFEKIKSLSLSVVPENTISSTSFIPKQKERHPAVNDYYPETRGLSLTGKLTEGASRNPVSGKSINMSIIGEGRDFMAVSTDNRGRFFFALPDYTGTRDIFLCVEKTELADLKIWVDNDFCALPVYLPSPIFNLTEPERQAVQNMALNMQINSYFHPDTLSVADSTKKQDIAFYGKPATVLYLDQFIQLPTLEEYFNELPGLVKVRKRMGEKYFKIIGSGNLSFYNPLVLVDWVAVDEPSRILAVSPQNISRIEIVNEAYVKGGQTYGGIISIISKKGDFAGIDLPAAGIFINYRFLGENKCQEVDYPPSGSSYPDTRNTFLWKPNISLQNDTSENFVFAAPETPGKYIIVLEGIRLDGEKFLKTSDFTVN